MKIALPCIIALFATASFVAAQSTTSATVVGTVTDPQGAVVQGATVTMTNGATGGVTQGKTNADGAYYIPYLAPGNYSLTIEATGFEKYQQTGITLDLGAVPRFDVKLTVGAQTSEVQVSATSSPLLETQSVDIGGLQDAKLIQSQPIMQAKPAYVMYYTVGSEAGGTNTFILAGLPGQYLNFSLDGIGAKQTPRSAIGTVNNSVTPPVDALQEAKVWAVGIPADLGHDAGGAMNMVVKSGTNQVHWTAEERYIQHDWIHRQIWQQAPLTTPFEYHNFDTTLGFPIYIPKIYDGRNKSFLFLAERFDYDHETDAEVGNVPTLGMLGEDPNNPGNYEFNWAGAQPIYDPATYACTGGTGPACTGGTWSAKQFPNNIIPGSRVNAVAKNFLAHMPYAVPNAAGTFTATGPNNNLNANNYYLADKEGYIARFDQVLGGKDKIYYRWAYNIYNTHPSRENVIYNWLLIDPTSQSFGRPEWIDTVNHVIGETHVFSPSIVNQFRAGYQSRQDVVHPFADNENWASQLGMSAGIPGTTFPAFVSSGNSSVTWSAEPGNFYRILQYDFDTADDLTWVKGHHVFKFGWEGMDVRENDSGTGSTSASTTAGVTPLPSGFYSFSGATSGAPFKSNTGNSFASFLLGAPDSATFTKLLEKYEPRWWSNELYVEDSWRTTSKLTLNLGIRYTLETGANTGSGYKAEFNPGVTDPLTGDMGAITNPTGSLYPNSGNNWAPRIGVAYNFRPNWVFRGSYDLFTVDDMAEIGMDNYEGYYVLAPPVGSPLPGMLLDQPVTISYPTGSAPNTSYYQTASSNYSGRSATYLDPNLHNGHTESYSAGVQWQVKPNTMIEVDYIGSRGWGLVNPNAVNINDLPQSIYQSTNLTLLNTVYPSQQNYLPFPQFGPINYYKNWDGSRFNSGVIDFQKRFSQGMGWDFHYTMEKIIDSGPGNNTVNTFIIGTGPQLNVALNGTALTVAPVNNQATDVIDSGSFKHQFTGNVSYDLPFGHGRRFLNHGGLVDKFVGGWNILTIQSLRSGQPISFTQSGNPNHELAGETQFMSVVPGQSIKNSAFHFMHHGAFPEQNQVPYYNISAFQYPAAYTFGNEGTDTSTEGGIYWPQYSLVKVTTFKERYGLTVRMDADNMFPTVSYANAMNTTANVTSPSLFGKTASQSYGFSNFASPNPTLVGSLRLSF